MRQSLSALLAAVRVALVTAFFAAHAVALLSVSATGQSAITIEQLQSQGWEIAGYAALALENRSFILFKHKDHKHLVQCSVRYDVTRKPSVITNCYELR